MTAKDDCYRLIQILVVKRDGVCQHPGCCNTATVAHHIFKRDRMGTAFLPEALVGLCERHHVVWAHAEPDEFREFMIGRIGEKYYELQRLSNSVVKHFDFEECRERLRKTIKKGGRL